MKVESSMEHSKSILDPWGLGKSPGSRRLSIKVRLNCQVGGDCSDTFRRKFFNVIKQKFSYCHEIINFNFIKFWLS